MAATANGDEMNTRKSRATTVPETNLAQDYSLSDFKNEELTRLTIKLPEESVRVLKVAALFRKSNLSDLCWESLAVTVDELADEYNLEDRI